ncbi:MAG: site-specific DNA-methyltransferase [Chloroflexota bacterium]
MPTLHWLKDEEARKTSSQIPYRLLEADPKLSYGVSDSENMLIQGDNLEALKALMPYYAGQVKCIYIDPPYNTQSAFEHYDDNLEHSIWLSTMYPRLEMLRELLAQDGSIWFSIDDNEIHYFRVILDEIFGRDKFVATNVWQKRYSRENREAIGDAHDYVLTYCKDVKLFKETRNLLPLGEKQKSQYKNPNNDPRGSWQSVSLLAQGYRPNQMYEIVAPNGKKHIPPPGNCWKIIKSEYDKLIAVNRVYFGKDGNGVPRRIHFLKDAEGVVPWTWWNHEEVGHTGESKNEVNELFGSNVSFETAKPERLIQRVLQIATNPGDLVLDSFLGSGTTAAVAHKMGRRYIGVEMGEHAVTHCAPRLKKVIEGEQGGISKEANWQGGGGFHFYRLGETIFDEQGHINEKVKFKPLAAHVWFSETHTPLLQMSKTSLLGIHNETAYYLLYNGILGDTDPKGGNVLTPKILRQLSKHKGKKIIYGEMSMLEESVLQKEEITFKHIPYDIKAR